MDKNLRFDETIAWLMAAKTPSIRYLTMTKLKGLSPTNPEVESIRQLIPTTLPVREMLEAQDPGGFWFTDYHFYSPKYRSSHWSSLLLSEFAIDPAHESMQRGANFMLNRVFESKDDYWTFNDGVGCFWGNWLRYQLYSGNSNDERVSRIIDRTCKDIHDEGVCKYNDNLPCAWGVIRDLFGLALIPVQKRNQTVKEAIAAGIHFTLNKFQLLQANYPYMEKIHPLWSKLNFPLFYHADVLFTLRVIQELGELNHPGAQEPLDWLREKIGKNNFWRGGSPFRSRTWPFVNSEDTVNHWLTLQALQVLSGID